MAADECAITEITIQPDGRIYVFGLSVEVADILEALCPAEHPLHRSLSMTQLSPTRSPPHDADTSMAAITRRNRRPRRPAQLRPPPALRRRPARASSPGRADQSTGHRAGQA